MEIFDTKAEYDPTSNLEWIKLTDHSIFDSWIASISEKQLFYESLFDKHLLSENETKVLITSLRLNEKIRLKQLQDEFLSQETKNIFSRIENQDLSNALNIFLSLRKQFFNKSTKKVLSVKNGDQLRRALKPDGRMDLYSGYMLKKKQVHFLNSILMRKISTLQRVLDYLHLAKANLDNTNFNDVSSSSVFISISHKHPLPDPTDFHAFPFIEEKLSNDYERYEIIFKNLTGSFESAVFYNSGKYLITGGNDCTIKCYRLSDSNLKFILFGHQSKVINLILFNREKNLISASYDKTIRIWDLHSKTYSILNTDQDAHITYISLDSSEQNLAFGDSDCMIYVYSFTKKRVIFNIQMKANASYIKIFPYKVGKNALVINYGNLHCRMININKNTLIAEFNNIKGLRLTNDNKTLILSYPDYTEIHRIDRITKMRLELTLLNSVKMLAPKSIVNLNSNETMLVNYLHNFFHFTLFKNEYKEVINLSLNPISKLLSSNQVEFLQGPNSKIYIVDYNATVTEISFGILHPHRETIMRLEFFQQKNTFFDALNKTYLMAGYEGIFIWKNGDIRKYPIGIMMNCCSSSILFCYVLLGRVTISKISDPLIKLYEELFIEKCVLAVSRDSKWIAISDTLHKIKFMSFDGERVKHEKTINEFYGEGVECMDFSFDTKYLCVGGQDYILYLINFYESPSIIIQLYLFDSSIKKLLALPDNCLLVACNAKKLKCFNILTGSLNNEVSVTDLEAILKYYGTCEAYKLRTLF